MERTKRSYKMEGAILSNDPSFTAWGWVVLDFKGNILDVGCIKTEPEHKKRKIRKGDDTVRRIGQIDDTLNILIKKWNVLLVLTELVHGSQNASAAVMMGAVTAIVKSTCDALAVPVEWYSEHDAKVHLFGKRAVTKRDMIIKIAERYDVPWTETKYKDEAIADALAIYDVALISSSVLRFLKYGKY